MLVNLLWFGQAVATAEVLLLGQREGIDREVMVHALACSSAASTFVRRDIEAVFDDDYLPSFGLDRICEELEAVTALAHGHGGAVGTVRSGSPDVSPRPRPVRAGGRGIAGRGFARRRSRPDTGSRPEWPRLAPGRLTAQKAW